MLALTASSGAADPLVMLETVPMPKGSEAPSSAPEQGVTRSPAAATSVLAGERAQFVAALLAQYRRGWFLMADSEDPALAPQWVQPRRRAIIPLSPAEFHIPRTLRRRVLGGRFEIRTDTAFLDVIQACAGPRPYGSFLRHREVEATWLDPTIIGAFAALHEAGVAHSIEAWLPPPPGETRPILVGGLYGLALGSAFCGESMFTRPSTDPSRDGTDASKVCLVHLVHHLRRQGFRLLDSQIMNHHVAQFGAYEISRLDYLSRVRGLAEQPRPWLPFEPDLHRRDLLPH